MSGYPPRSMTTYIALLRGINVGGSGRTIRMADLRSILGDAGYRDVATYIQSGNVVFTSEDRTTSQLASLLEDQIEAGTGLRVPVMLRTAEDWSSLVDGNPYDTSDPTKVHVAFLAGDPDPDAADTLRKAATGGEDFRLDGHHIYLHLPEGMGRAELPKGLTNIGTPATVRNWRTVAKLWDLASERR